MARYRKGFTLIELLVVIAIIAILAAILFPVFVSAQERARAASCASNMKQLGVAIQLYVDSYNGCYPDQSSVGLYYQPSVAYSSPMGEAWIRLYSHRYRDSAGRPAGLGLVLGKYTKNMSVFKCPSERRITPPGVFDFGLTYAESTSYYFKHAVCYEADRAGKPISSSQVKYLTRATLLYEAGWHTGRYPYIWDITYWRNKTDRAPMHVGAVFFDGHAGKIDIPYNTVSAYDGNWYFYGGQDLEDGARDRP